MMKILPLGREKNGLSLSGNLSYLSVPPIDQTTCKKPDMYPKEFIGPPNPATIVPQGYSQFQAYRPALPEMKLNTTVWY